MSNIAFRAFALAPAGEIEHDRGLVMVTTVTSRRSAIVSD
jgi:hypothetical protein